MSIYIDGGDFIGRMIKLAGELGESRHPFWDAGMEARYQRDKEDELVSKESPFGDYYVPRAKRDRSRELRAALAALEDTNGR